MRKKNVWKIFFWEAVGLALFAALLALAANHFREDRLALQSAPASAAPPPGLTLVTPAQAMQSAVSDNVIFIDARSPLEFADGHVSGAVNLSYAEAKLRNSPLRLILYCDGEECAMADNLGTMLLERGVEISVMPKGIAGWFATGGLVEAGK